MQIAVAAIITNASKAQEKIFSITMIPTACPVGMKPKLMWDDAVLRGCILKKNKMVCSLRVMKDEEVVDISCTAQCVYVQSMGWLAKEMPA